jgi:hypothetical protein
MMMMMHGPANVKVVSCVAVTSYQLNIIIIAVKMM